MHKSRPIKTRHMLSRKMKCRLVLILKQPIASKGLIWFVLLCQVSYAYFFLFVHLYVLCISLTACVSGFFKAAQGDHKCLQCPINSRTTNEGATNCVCRNGYYRTDSDPQQMPCTSMCLQTAMTVQSLNINAPAANYR